MTLIFELMRWHNTLIQSKYLS